MPLVKRASLAPALPNFLARASEHFFVVGVLPLHEIFDDLEQALALDFDDFLAWPARSLAAVAAHLRLAHDEATIASALDPGVLGSYAKATDHAYDAAARAADLAESQRRFRDEIDAGLRFAERTIARYPSLAALGALLS